MTYEEIVKGLRDSTYELENEGRQVRAGLKAEQDTAAIIERYAWLYSEEAVAAVGPPVDEERKRVRGVILHGIVERRTAAQDHKAGCRGLRRSSGRGGRQSLARRSPSSVRPPRAMGLHTAPPDRECR